MSNKRKDDTVPLWARKNSQARVMARKPDVIPLWARGQSQAIAAQVPTNPVALALHRSRHPKPVAKPVAAIAAPEAEPVPATEQLPIRRDPMPHPFAHMTREQAEAMRRRQYQNAAIQAHDTKLKAQAISKAQVETKAAAEASTVVG
jgi:hypothetical protein